MWRTMGRPRWLALLAVVLVAATGMARLGEWQLQRARELGGQQQREQQQVQAARPAVPLSSLVAPQHAFPAAAQGRRVEVDGHWDPSRQLLVAGRLQDGVSGWWVLTALVVDGASLPVVRGWTAYPAAAPSPVPPLPPAPAGTIRVSGVLLPGEAAVDRPPGAGSGLPADQLDRIDPAELVQRWGAPIYTGFVVSTGTPGQASGSLALVSLASSGGGLALQNLSYAIQWWLFAAFGLFFWWRLVRDDHRGLLPAGSGPAGGHPAGAVMEAVGDDGR